MKLKWAIHEWEEDEIEWSYEQNNHRDRIVQLSWLTRPYTPSSQAAKPSPAQLMSGRSLDR